MNYSNSQRAGVILYLTALLFGAYDKLSGRTKGAIITQAANLGLKYKKHKYITKHRDKYVVQLRVNGKMIRFGTFDSEEEAAKVAMEKAREYGKKI